MGKSGQKQKVLLEAVAVFPMRCNGGPHPLTDFCVHVCNEVVVEVEKFWIQTEVRTSNIS